MKGVFNMAFSIDELTKKAKDMAAAAADKAKGAADLAKINVAIAGNSGRLTRPSVPSASGLSTNMRAKFPTPSGNW